VTRLLICLLLCQLTSLATGIPARPFGDVDGQASLVAISNTPASSRVHFNDRQRTRTDNNERGHSTLTTHDRMGREIGVTKALGQSRTFGYDANGNRTSETDFRGHARMR